jgi:hypothetical protein
MKGTIYRIVSISHPEIQYVGSTGSTMAQRWYQHKRDFAAWKNDPSRRAPTIYPYILACGIDDFQILKIKDYEVIDKHHLSTYEQLYVNRIRCVNKNNPWHVSTANCKWLKQEYQRIQSVNNRDELAIYHKEWYQNNKEKYVGYRQKNKEQIQAKASQLDECVCGKSYSHGHKSRHEKTKFHTDRV